MSRIRAVNYDSLPSIIHCESGNPISDYRRLGERSGGIGNQDSVAAIFGQDLAQHCIGGAYSGRLDKPIHSTEPTISIKPERDYLRARMRIT